ncbi:MAG: hypothetical protein CMJ48_00600 [Planctomycetaceae bacterium]|nr:hypothetical protein [Planctomycetaceae bacterium]
MSETLPRCQVVPMPGHQASFQIDGVERLAWHFGSGYPRPFFYPLLGPAGATLTRMGHPGASNHDHHRSVWFAHNKVLGVDFWSDLTSARIRQKQWLAYQDSDDEAVMAVLLEWFDGHDAKPLLEQQVVAGMRPGPENETLLELQSTFTPTSDSLEFQQTNFGFLAVRVAKSLSAYFGSGQLTNSEGRQDEPNIFGKPARWMDYSGPVPSGAEGVEAVANGITYFDHPKNPGFPNSWHVREDGWMGCSINMHTPLTTPRKTPLRLRFLLHAHNGSVDKQRAEKVAQEFAGRPEWEVVKSKKRHTEAVVRRVGEEG